MKKKGNKKMPTPRSFITPSLFLSRLQHLYVYSDFEVSCFYCLTVNKQSNIFQHNKDVGMGL